MDTCGTIFPQPFYSGDDIEIDIQFYEPDKATPKPMNGYTVGMTIKKSINDGYGNPVPDSESIYQADLAGDPTGLFHFMIPGETNNEPTFVPGEFYLDVKQWGSTGKRSNILTTMLPINQSVTIRLVP